MPGKDLGQCFDIVIIRKDPGYLPVQIQGLFRRQVQAAATRVPHRGPVSAVRGIQVEVELMVAFEPLT